MNMSFFIHHLFKNIMLGHIFIMNVYIIVIIIIIMTTSEVADRQSMCGLMVSQHKDKIQVFNVTCWFNIQIHNCTVSSYYLDRFLTGHSVVSSCDVTLDGSDEGIVYTYLACFLFHMSICRTSVMVNGTTVCSDDQLHFWPKSRMDKSHLSYCIGKQINYSCYIYSYDYSYSCIAFAWMFYLLTFDS